MQKWGYIRVSTKEQHVDRQITALLNAGVPMKNIFIDKVSGKDFERPEYKKMMKKLRVGDVLMLRSFYRFGRDYDDNIEQWKLITTKIRADIVVLDMPLLDTTKMQGLLGKLIIDIVLQVLSYAAQSQRELLLADQAEGIVEAKKRGVKFGRPKIEKPPEYEAVKNDYVAGEFSSREAAELLNVSQTKFLEWFNEK